MRRLNFLTTLILTLLTVGIVFAQPTPPVPPLGDIPLVTNTPRPADTLLTYPRLPDAIDFYALRLWTSDQLFTVLENQLNTLATENDADMALAARVTTYEIQKRYPRLFNDPDIQARLLPLFLRAPRGSVNMQAVVHPYLEGLMTANRAMINPNQPQNITVGAFDVTLQPINATPLQTNDMVLIISAPSGASENDRRYQEIVFARETNGTFDILEANTPYPVAPFEDVESLTLERLGDLNRDRTEEIAISVQYTNQMNNDLLIYTLRGDIAFELTQPGQRMQFSSIANWDMNSDRFTLIEQRASDSYWGCLEQRGITWTWGANVFVPTEDVLGFTESGGLACRLEELDNLFYLPPGEAVISIGEVANVAVPGEEDTLTRAMLNIAMLYVMDGQRQQAVAFARRVIEESPPTSPRIAQAEQLLSLLGRPDLTTLEMCGIMAVSEPDAVCNIQDVLLRVLLENPLQTDTSVENQLATRGIPVRRIVTLTEIGRRDRTAIELDLADGIWLTLTPAANNRGTYVPVIIPTPAAYTPQEEDTEQTVSERALLNLMLVNDDVSAVIAAIETVDRTVDAPPLTPELRFVLALGYDLTGNRGQARRAYYDLWATQPDTVWGRLAAQHLERR